MNGPIILVEDLKTQFEPFRFKGTTVKDGMTYNKYELWDGIVLIESGLLLFMEEES